MAADLLLSLMLLVLAHTPIQGAEEGEYRINVTLSGSVTVTPQCVLIEEGQTLTVCVVDFTTNANVVVTMNGETATPEINSAVVVTMNGETAPPEINSAIGGIDYTPSEVSLRFSPSTKNQTKCAEFAIIQDGLDEGRENFTIKFSKDDQPPGSTEANVTIVACRRGDVLISSEKLRDLLSPVQYCMDSDDWVTLCDVRDNWTRNDATVICRQSGRYSEGEDVNNFMIGSQMKNPRDVIPVCHGNETRIDDCNNDPPTNNDGTCQLVLVYCGTSSNAGSNAGAIAAGITVPLILLLAVVSAVIVTLFLLWKKGIISWESIKALCKKRDQKQIQPQASNTTSSGSVLRVQNHSNGHDYQESEAEYTAPFTALPFPITPAPTTHSRQPPPSAVDNEHYEGCDVAAIVAAAKKVPRAPVSRKPGKTEPPPVDDYSHLQH